MSKVASAGKWIGWLGGLAFLVKQLLEWIAANPPPVH